MSLSVGDVLDDRYELLLRLGEGGQAEVWKARDRLRPERPVALKLIALARTPESALERLRREAAALHALAHPSLIRCHRAFEDLSRKLFGLTLEYFEGSTVEDALADPRFTVERRKRVMRHLAAALAYLHERGIVHRDLKPENVLLGAAFWGDGALPEHVKLIDLGIAALEGNPRPMTDVGRVIGTLPYMAPEVIDPGTFPGQVTGPSRDVFAFGVMGWILLAGRHPSGVVDGDMRDYGMAYRSAAQGTLAWPQGNVEGAWSRVLRGCCALDARLRPPSGVEIVAALAGRALLISSASVSRRGAGPAAPSTGTAPHLAPTSEVAPHPSALRPSHPSLYTMQNGATPAGELPSSPSIPTPPPRPAAKARPGALLYLLAGAVIALGSAVLVPRLRQAVEGSGAPPPRLSEAPSPAPSPTLPARAEAPVPARAEAPLPVVPALPSRGDSPADPGPEAPPPPSGLAPAAGIRQPTLADNPFAAACCVETECAMTARSEAYFNRWSSKASGETCLCASGNKLQGCCERMIPRAATWSLRLSNVIENNPNPRAYNVIEPYPDAEVCVKRSVDNNNAFRCKPLTDANDARGVSMGVRVTTEDLESGGLDIVVFKDASHRKYLAHRMGALPRDRPLGPVTLCIGLKYITGFTSGLLVDPSVSFFLDPVP